MNQKTLDISVVEALIMKELHNSRNEDPQHRVRNKYAGNFLRDGVDAPELDAAIRNLHKKGLIQFEDAIFNRRPGMPFPLIDSTFHLPK